MSENLEYYQNQIISARTEIRNLRQKLSALKHQHSKEINTIKSMLSGLRCANCTTEPATRYIPIQQRQDTPSPTEDISYTPIGYIETSFENKRAVPRQPTVLYSAKGVVVINTDALNNPEHALSGLEEFSHMWIIFHFHSTASRSVPAKISPPRLAGEKRGVFSTRSPHRPCPIGLSLVKIHSIEGNKINFHGVDMINGTPILDIKPYIPQYDYPLQTYDSISFDRPPTEGTSDALELNNLQLNVPDVERLSPRLQNPLGIATNSLDSPFDEETPSPIQNISASVSPLTVEHEQPAIQRGDPDGQERFTPPQRIMNFSDGIRVPNWITNPPSQRYKVIFTEEALDRLSTLIGDRARNFKTNIEQLLSEDPRSLYVRTRYPDHEYSCVLEDVSISCEFDSDSSVCTIVAVRNAEDLQN